MKTKICSEVNDITIVIPTFNRPNILHKVIGSYLSQKYVAKLIIIDDGSQLSYGKIIYNINYWEKMYNVGILYKKNNKNLGAPATRNLALQYVTTKYIFWGEDDAFLSKRYLEVLHEKVEKKEKTAFCGRIFYGISPEMTVADKLHLIHKQSHLNKPIFNYKLLEGYYRKYAPEDICIPFGHALMLIPQKAYQNVRYYEAYKINGYREESDAQVAMLKYGYKIYYTSLVNCYHFPNFKDHGGQHTRCQLIQEVYKIINNSIFLDRNYETLKTFFILEQSKSVMKIVYAYYIFIISFRKVIKKIRRMIVKNENLRDYL